MTHLPPFLARNREFQDIGKKAIAITILAAESVRKLKERKDKGDHDWYSYLFHKLTDGLTNKNDYIHFGENNVSFITFNYDRSLEYFLYDSLIHYFYKIPPEKIKEQLIKLKIIHVFGQVAGLEWQDLSSKIEYRRNVNQIDIQRLVKNIRTIYEEKDNPELEEAHKRIRDAEQIFFLGFGYAKENLKLLKIPEILYTGHKIFGTALGSTQKEIGDIKKLLMYSTKITNLDCLMLLRQYW